MSSQSPCKIEFIPTDGAPIVLVAVDGWLSALPRFEASQDLFEPAGILAGEGYFRPLGTPSLTITFAADDEHADTATALDAFLDAGVVAGVKLLRTAGALRITGPHRIDTYEPAVINGITPGLPFGPTAVLSRAFQISAAMPGPPQTLPVCTVLPVISAADMEEGEPANATTGTWSGAGLSYAFQWYRDGLPILGATANTYTLAAADDGAELTVRVAATNTVGTAAATSAPLAVAFPATAPSVITPPSITASDDPPVAGTVFTRVSGTYSGTAPLYIEGRWQGLVAGVWEYLTGATIFPYTLTEPLPEAIRFHEHVTNDAGETATDSNVIEIPGAGDTFLRPGGGTFKRPGGGEFLRP